VRRRELSVRLGSAEGALALAVRVHSNLCLHYIAKLSLPVLVVASALTLPGTISRAETVPRSVLILDESGPGALNPGYAEISRAFRSRLMATSPARIYAMNLDFNDFSSLQYHVALRNFIKVKYQNAPIGVLLAVGSSALEFALQLRTEHWPDVPIVFAAADEDTVAKLVDPGPNRNVTGRTLRFSIKGSIEVARALVPGLKQIVLVGDPLEKQPFRRHFKAELARAAPELALKDLTGLPLAEVKKHVASLPSDSAILYTAITDDGAGTTYLPQDAGKIVAEASNRPVVVDVDNRIGRGGTGGAVVRPTLVGEEAAQLVLRIFDGEDASQIPHDISESMKPLFDWRELKRWGISEAQLPSGSEVRFRELAAWEQYRTQIVVILLALLFQSALIAALLYEDRRRRAAEARSLELSGELAHVNRVATAGELVASIAHEIRQPLAAIVARGSAGLNWLKKAAPDLDKVRGALENIVDNGHRADQVLRNTRAMFDKGDTSQATLNVNKVVDEVLALVEDRITEERIQLIKSYGEMPVPAVRANRIQLQQVFLNLTMNAIEAMSTMSGGDRVLKLTTEVTRTGSVLIAVQDSGPGIASDQLDLIFKSFFTTKPDGMGVGLSICKTIIEGYGGQLIVAHGDPVGTVFTIDLPLRVRRQHAANNHDPAAESQNGSPNR
jgi:signal transduction histidine kinase